MKMSILRILVSMSNSSTSECLLVEDILLQVAMCAESGRYLAMLPVDPKLGKMLIMGAIFCCFDPVLTIVAGLSVKDPFLLPQDKKDVSIQLFCLYLCLFLLHL